jgi:acetoacetyl-CoA synthetase
VWFPGASLNYVDLALRRRDDADAVIFQAEDGSAATLSWHELAEMVRLAAAGLRRLGLEPGDRVAAYVPNRVETIVAFLATVSLGAVWTATSPDFGDQGVLARFRQVEPKLLFVVGGYTYGGRWHDRMGVVRRLVDGLPSVRHVISLPGGEISSIALEWSALAEPSEEPLVTEAVPFDYPLWIVYTSGTTGTPKPIVHGHGGVVLEHYKLVRYHLDLTPQDRFFWFSSTGWVMWNILVGGLIAGVPIVVYDGSPAYPTRERLWDLAASTQTSFIGLSAGFIQMAMRNGHRPGSGRDLSGVRAVGVTGSPLPAAGYWWLREHLREPFVASVSGGTDVATAFIGSTPSLPIRAGRLQSACLGVDAAALDSNGRRVVGATGELVVCQPIPSMPLFFWGDPTGDRYRASYFETYPGCWRHGDWVEFDEDGSCVVFGRSDATLNRGGVRMGTGDFYGVLDTLPTVADALVLDTTSADDPEGRLVLVLQPAAGVNVDGPVIGNIRTALRTSLSPRHDPDDIVIVERLPHTINGKRLEVPAKRLFQGVPIEQAVDVSAVDDAQALALLAQAARDWRNKIGAGSHLGDPFSKN